MITISLAMILAGGLGILSFIKGRLTGAAACNLNETISSCSANSGSITGAVVGALQSGGLMTGIVALFVVALGALILITTMRQKE